MITALRYAIAAVCFSGGFALVGLMARSYSWCDAVVYEPEHGKSYVVRSIEGSFVVRRTINLLGCSNPTWRGSSNSLRTMQQLDAYRKQNASPSHLGAESGIRYSSTGSIYRTGFSLPR